MTTLRVLFISREYPPDTQFGGEAIACADMAGALASAGHDVHVICQAVDFPHTMRMNNVTVHRVGLNSARYSVAARLDFLFHATRAQRALGNFDVVDGFYGSIEILPFLFTRLLTTRKIPLVVHAHGSIRYAILWTKSYQGTMGAIIASLQLIVSDFCARHANLVVAISTAMRRELIEQSHTHDSRTLLLAVPRKVEVLNESKAPGHRLPNDVEPTHIVLYVGRLERRKGVDLLCQAIPRVKEVVSDARFILVGVDTPTGANGGSFKSNLIKILEQTGHLPSVIFVENVPPLELDRLYSEATVVVSPSLFETSASVPLEAMAREKPVVITNTGIADLLGLDGSNGSIVPVGDVGKLAEEIVRFLLLDNCSRAIIGKRNRETILSRFKFEQWANQISILHSRLVHES